MKSRFKRAIELNPNYVTAHEHYGGLLACMRRTDEAITHGAFGATHRSLVPGDQSPRRLSVLDIHRYDLNLEQARTLFALESDFFGAYWISGLANWGQGTHEAAVADLRKAVTLGGGPIQLADLGCLLGRLDPGRSSTGAGRIARARKADVCPAHLSGALFMQV